MCQFCAQHGDGKVWYLQAENYVADLENDLERKGYMIDFVQGFDSMRGNALTWLGVLEKTPKPVQTVVKSRLNKRQQINHYGQPVPIEECDRIFDFATSIVQLPCPCRTFSGKSERGLCLAVTTKPIDSTLEEAFSGYDTGPDTKGLQRLTKPQAMELLRQAERDGLMHSVWTFVSPMIGAICNCDLDSGCMAMTLTIGHDTKVMWRGEWVAELAEDSCTDCGACAHVCPFDAIDFDRKERRVTLRQTDCWGCGVCRAACRQDALTLVPRTSVPEVAEIW